MTARFRSNAEAFAKARGLTLAELDTRRLAAIPAGRIGTPEEFGALCAFLCSRQAGYFLAQNVLLDGGAYPGTF